MNRYLKEVKTKSKKCYVFCVKCKDEKDQTKFDSLNHIRIELDKEGNAFKWTMNFLFAKDDNPWETKLHQERKCNNLEEAKAQIIDVVYELITGYKYIDARWKSLCDKVLYQGRILEVEAVTRNILHGPYHTKIKTKCGVVIQKSIDWDYVDYEKFVTGEVRCNKCKRVGGKEELCLRFVKAYGPICGPCIEYLGDCDLIKEGDFQL